MGKVKCKRCEGEGKYTDYSDDVQAMYFKRCERCGGKGYLEEEVVGETLRVVPRLCDALEAWKEAALEGGDLIEALVDALEEREREVEQLSKRLEDCENLSADRWSIHIRTLHTIYAMYGRMEESQAEVERLKQRVNRMLTAGMGKDWGDGFEDVAGSEAEREEGDE